MRKQERENVEAALGDGRVICTRCGATLATFADVCSAPLDKRCEGFEKIDSARSPRLALGDAP